MSILDVSNLAHAFGDKVLYKDSSFCLNRGEHMGVVGQNGTGKSTLIRTLLGEVMPDEGTIKWLPGIQPGYLDQHAELDGNTTIRGYLNTAYAELFETERKLNEINQQLITRFDDKLVEKAAGYQQTLEKSEFYRIDQLIGRVAAGLGLTAIGLDRRLDMISGGQRAKVILAKLLLQKPEAMLLDEPTNFLDKQHIEWFSGYLKSYPGAFMIVSHNLDFLDRVTSCICEIEFQKISRYSGSYSSYIRQKQLRRDEYVKNFESQRKEIQRTEVFIAKNMAGTKSKQAKSRQKMLDRIERLAPPTFLQKPSFRFLHSPVSAAVVLQAEALVVGYGAPLLPKLDFKLRNGARVALTGFNGIGKTTMLRTFIGELPQLSGTCRIAADTSVGYFEQDPKWEDDRLTPLKYILQTHPKMSPREARSKLASCGVKAEHADRPLSSLSGGEQAKVKLCGLIAKPCSLLLLDEPTNHLDAETKEAFQAALKAFPGSVILVSHEESFYSSWANQIINIENMVKKK